MNVFVLKIITHNVENIHASVIFRLINVKRKIISVYVTVKLTEKRLLNAKQRLVIILVYVIIYVIDQFLHNTNNKNRYNVYQNNINALVLIMETGLLNVKQRLVSILVYV